MSFDALLTLAIVVSLLLVLATTTLAVDIVLLAAMVLVMAIGIVTPERALEGFANPGVITVAVLYVVVAGLRETGAMAWVSQRIFGHPRTIASAQSRLMIASGVLSSVVNNTPVVALFIPVAQEWASRLSLPVSKLLLPMNHVAILAGMCTLIGTNTNLVVNGLLTRSHPEAVLGIFDLAWVGVPLTVMGIAYVLLMGRWLLPDRKGAIEQFENARQYSFEVRIQPGGPLVGRTIAQVGLRRMQYAYLLEIERSGRLMTAVGPEEVLQGSDLLIFVGVVDAVRDLRRIPGLAIAEEQTYKLNLANSQRCLVELVLAPSSPLIGKTVREAGFRSRYQAAIISISRDGRRLEGKVGDIRLRAGDTLLVEAHERFADRHRYSRDFLLVSRLQDSTPPDFSRTPLALGILGLMVIAAATGLTSLLVAAFIAAALMVATGCVTLGVARRSVEYPIVVGIAAAYALGAALMDSGAAASIAEFITGLAGDDPLWALFALYLITVVVTEMITNTAAGVLMFPIALAAAEQAGVSYLPFVVVVMIGASAGFVTPIGYQTNLMIYGPGGYRFGDYVRFGLPLSVLTGTLALLIIPRVWPL